MAFQYVDYPQKMKDLLMQIFDDSFMQANTRFQSFEGLSLIHISEPTRPY